jgi:hypothetical protein
MNSETTSSLPLSKPEVIKKIEAELESAERMGGAR